MSTSRSTLMGLKCFPGVKANPEVLTLHFLCPIFMQLERSRASSLLKTCVAKYLARKNLACVGLRRAKIPGTLTVSEMFLLDVPQAWASDPQSRATCMGTPLPSPGLPGSLLTASRARCPAHGRRPSLPRLWPVVLPATSQPNHMDKRRPPSLGAAWVGPGEVLGSMATTEASEAE